MVRHPISVGEYYHIYNRGVEKRDIFLNDDDRWRFLSLLVLAQGDFYVPKMSKLIPKIQRWMLDDEVFQDIAKVKIVNLVNFCLMPNHFHLILEETTEGGISKFMQKVGDSYTKYFNIKYQRSGHLFGGKFQAIHIDDNSYLTYLSAYIHLNPTDLSGWSSSPEKYPWSSFQDCVDKNRMGQFLDASIILDQFDHGSDYKF